MIQALWKGRVDWDAPIPETVLTEWTILSRDLMDLSLLRVPRKVIRDSSEVIHFELHGFADASQSAYAACFYLRSVSRQRQTTVRLLCAKSRIAPLKQITIPRLGLSRAVLITQLMNQVRSALTVPINDTYAWSDSTITLLWIKGDVSRLKQFVANRVIEIQDTLPSKHWCYVNTTENPADLFWNQGSNGQCT